MIVQITGVAELQRRMNDIARDQAPFAMAKAMTTTVRQAKTAEDAHIVAAFSSPTPFTQRAVAFKGATKKELKASVFIKDAQAKYLLPEATGGRREFKTFEERFATGGQPTIVVPGRGAPLNQYGNLTKAKIKRIAKDVNTSGKAKRFFAGTPKGGQMPAGVYARTNKNMQLTPLLVFATDAVYEKRFKFSEIAMMSISATFEANLLAAWKQAVDTAR